MANQKWRKSKPLIYHKDGANGSTKDSHSPCEKRFRQRRFHNLVRNIFIVVPLATQNHLIIRDGSVEVVENVWVVRIQSICIVYFLIVDVYFNIGKNWLQNVSYMCNGRNWSLLLVLFRLHIRYSFFFVHLLDCFAIVSFITTTFDIFQFQSPVRLSQINVIVPIRLKFQLYANLIKWGGRMVFLFVGRQGIVN